MGRRGFGLDHPLLDEFGEQLVVAFRLAFDQLLKRPQLAHLALQDDVALDAGHNAVHDAP